MSGSPRDRWTHRGPRPSPSRAALTRSLFNGALGTNPAAELARAWPGAMPPRAHPNVACIGRRRGAGLSVPHLGEAEARERPRGVRVQLGLDRAFFSSRLEARHQGSVIPFVFTQTTAPTSRLAVVTHALHSKRGRPVSGTQSLAVFVTPCSSVTFTMPRKRLHRRLPQERR